MPKSQESNIHMAISAYNSKKINSKKETAKVFGVFETILRERLKGRKPRSETRANNHILWPIQEVLVKQILNAEKRGFPIRLEFLRQMAQLLLQKQTPTSTPNIGVNWAFTFVRRHPQLRTRFNRRTPHQREKQEDPKSSNNGLIWY